MEYINKQQILEKAKQHQNSPFGASLIIAEIEKADEDLVRCKDCKHFTAGYCCRDIKGRSQMHYMGEEAFCSYGESTQQKEGY